jgi:hypothetical protein
MGYIETQTDPYIALQEKPNNLVILLPPEENRRQDERAHQVDVFRRILKDYHEETSLESLQLLKTANEIPFPPKLFSNMVFEKKAKEKNNSPWDYAVIQEKRRHAQYPKRRKHRPSNKGITTFGSVSEQLNNFLIGTSELFPIPLGVRRSIQEYIYRRNGYVDKDSAKFSAFSFWLTLTVGSVSGFITSKVLYFLASQ